MKETRWFTLETRYSSNNVKLVKSTYRNNGTLYVGLVCEDGEPFDNVTTNLSESGANNVCAFVKIDNDCLIKTSDGYCDLPAWLMDNDIADWTGTIAYSGYNSYVLMDFSRSITEIEKMR